MCDGLREVRIGRQDAFKQTPSAVGPEPAGTGVLRRRIDSAVRLGLPVGIEPVLKALGQASLPLGLLCVGAALEFGSMRQWLHPVGYSSLVKFLIMPLVTLWACHLFGLEGKAAIAALLFQALPTASSSYIMARQLGGDAPLMAGIIACQTLLAGVAPPAVILVMTQWV